MPPPPMGPGAPQPPRMYGMPPPMTSIGQHGAPTTGSSKIDPNQIPRPLPSSTAALYGTRSSNQANSSPVIIHALLIT